MFYDTTAALLARLRLMLFCIPLKSALLSRAKILSSYNEASKKKHKKKEIPFYSSARAERRASVWLKRPNERVLLAVLYSHAAAVAL